MRELGRWKIEVSLFDVDKLEAKDIYEASWVLNKRGLTYYVNSHNVTKEEYKKCLAKFLKYKSEKK